MTESRKLAAILAADVAGYSRLAGADEERILARLRALRSDLIDPTFAVHNGRVVKRTGDGALVEFRSVVDAVRCAIEIQAAMIERNAGVPPDRRIEFRIGVHLGDVVEESDGDLMGEGVNIAARMEGIARPGAICISEQAYWQVKGRLDIVATDLGPTQLKNIAEPVRVYALAVGVPAPVKPAIEPQPPGQKARPRRALLAAAIVALAGIAGGAWHYFVANRPALVASDAPARPAARLSIVALPFANLSGDPAQDYLADALTDELTTSLARIPDSFVIARNTAFTFKGKPIDAKAIGKDLGVRYVLEGSVQPGGNQVRVNAQLIDAESGAHVWAEQFDTPRADLLQTQDAIVMHLARAVEIQLTEAEAARLKRMPAANPDAEDLALQCTAAVRKSGASGKETEAGFKLCEQALALDPNNHSALLILSLEFSLPVLSNRSADPDADLKRADELVSRALALYPDSPYGHVFKAVIFTAQSRLDDAIAEYQRALALEPAAAEAYDGLGVTYARIGDYEKSLEVLDKAIRLSPHDPLLYDWYANKAGAYFGLKDYDQAIEWDRRAIATNPNKQSEHTILIAALALTGREAEAREALQRYLALFPDGARTIAALKARKAQLINPDPHYLELWDRTIEGLRKAGLPEE
ncbi:MAG: adenylate/guanylate cyclase domain-containing protein [Hyphomicrobiales bacterium]|nr:adenylate/guanylate cyclase domain-containing protein [Hyphomicrobiales bacterium]